MFFVSKHEILVKGIFIIRLPPQKICLKFQWGHFFPWHSGIESSTFLYGNLTYGLSWFLHYWIWVLSLNIFV